MKKKLEKCPKCGQLSVKYDSRSKSKRCFNSECNWTEAKLIAADVPKSFLKFCLAHAKNELQKERIETIIKVTYGSL